MTQSWLLCYFKIHIANSMQARTVRSQHPDTQHCTLKYYPDRQHSVHSQYYPNRQHSVHSQYYSTTQTRNTLYTHSTLIRYSVHSRQPLGNTDSDASGFPNSIVLHFSHLMRATCLLHLNLAIYADPYCLKHLA